MTPQEMLLRRGNHERHIELLRAAIRNDIEEAGKCPAPKNLRRAKVSDIKPGAIIWFPRYKWGSKWQIVQGIVDTENNFGFIASGVVWSMKGAWIEK